MDDPAATASTASSGTGQLPEHTNVKETIESILVAFIFAFMFRAFVVEAFVIPTGSMAPTLMGAHMRYRCDDCGYGFEVNYASPDADGDDVSIPSNARLLRRTRAADGSVIVGAIDKTYRIHCPNCGYRFPRRNPADPANVATNPPVFYGDRILVLKYLYLLFAPQRWDVVVFKSPYEPGRHDYTQNYIKRLIGTPGESVLILDGDVYVSTQGRESTPQDFTVQTKPRWVQEALWRIVHDNDFQPRGRPRTVLNAQGQPTGTVDPAFRQPWTPQPGEMGWDLTGKRTFKFSNPQGAATLAFDPEANRFAWSLTDWLAYDITVNQNFRDGPPDSYELGGYEPDNNVSDVKLAMHYQRQSGDGPLRLNITVRPGTVVQRAFTAELTRTTAKLVMRDRSGQETVIGTAPMPSDGSTPMPVELSHADYRVTLRVAGRDLITSTPQQYAPDIAFLLNNFAAMEKLPKPRISISAEKQQAEIRHLSLWRDVYYTNRKQGTGQNITHRIQQGAMDWATPEAFPERVMHLGQHEFFVCGDNSLISADGRYWTEPISLAAEALESAPGRVPGRFMLGKAFFVYWPAGYKPIAGDAVPSIVPNFGRMRFIH